MPNSGATTPVLTRRQSVSPPSARSLLLTVLGELVLPSQGPVWTSALLHVLDGLGVEEKSARQAIARTAADGWITSARDGRRVRWELAPRGRSLLTEGAARIYASGGHTNWDGTWLVVLASVPETQRRMRHQLQTRLAWAGFGNPTAGLWVSPHPDRSAEVAGIIADLGLQTAALSFVGSYGEIGSESALVARAWDLGEVAGQYSEFLDEFSEGEPRRGDATMNAAIRLVHAWRRFPFVDPGLPDQLLPENWAGHRARALFDRKHSSWTPEARKRWAELTAD